MCVVVLCDGVCCGVVMMMVCGKGWGGCVVVMG